MFMLREHARRRRRFFSEGLGRNRSTFKAVLYGLVIESMMVVYSGFSDKAETVLFEVL